MEIEETKNPLWLREIARDDEMDPVRARLFNRLFCEFERIEMSKLSVLTEKVWSAFLQEVSEQKPTSFYEFGGQLFDYFKQERLSGIFRIAELVYMNIENGDDRSLLTQAINTILEDNKVSFRMKNGLIDEMDC